MGGRVGSWETAAELVAGEGVVVVLELGVAPSDEDRRCMTAWCVDICRLMDETEGLDGWRCVH